MDSVKIGSYIAACRKQKDMTQQQLADSLNITNKAISKWETGQGLPDITILPELAEVLETSVDAILAGEEHTAISKDIVFTAETLITKQNVKRAHREISNALRSVRRIISYCLAFALFLSGIGIFVITRLWGSFPMYFISLACFIGCGLFMLRPFIDFIKSKNEYQRLCLRNGADPIIHDEFFENSFVRTLPSGSSIYLYNRISTVIDTENYIILRYLDEILYIDKNSVDAENFLPFLVKVCKNALFSSIPERRISNRRKIACYITCISLVCLIFWQIAYVIMKRVFNREYLYASTGAILLIITALMLAAFLFCAFYSKKKQLKRAMICSGIVLVMCIVGAVGICNSSTTYISENDTYSVMLKVDKTHFKESSVGEIDVVLRDKLFFVRPYRTFEYPVSGEIKLEWINSETCTCTYDWGGELHREVLVFGFAGANGEFENMAEMIKGEWKNDKWIMTVTETDISISDGKQVETYLLSEATEYGTTALQLNAAEDVPVWTIALNNEWIYDGDGYLMLKGAVNICPVTMKDGLTQELLAEDSQRSYLEAEEVK